MLAGCPVYEAEDGAAGLPVGESLDADAAADSAEEPES